MAAETSWRQAEGGHDPCVTTDIDTLDTALYVRTGDLLKQSKYLTGTCQDAGLLHFSS
jgi:hypothetical protein